MTTLSARSEAAQTLRTLLASLDLPEGSRDFLAGVAAGLDLDPEAIRQGLDPIPLVNKSQLIYSEGHEAQPPS